MDNSEEMAAAEAFAKWLRAARDGRSVRGVAAAAAISETYLRQLEKGYEEKRGHRLATRPSPRVVVGLARALKRDPVEALLLAGHNPDAIDAFPDRPDEMGTLIEQLQTVVDEMARLWSRDN